MSKNGYFQLTCDNGKVWFNGFLPKEGGTPIDLMDVQRYLEAINFPEVDLLSLDEYIKSERYAMPFLLSREEMLPEDEKCLVSIDVNGERALARFYPPSTGGRKLTEADIVSDLKFAGVCHGIQKKAIAHFLQHREYCRDYVLAKATPPVQGKDAKIEYFFDVNATAKPKMNEDGSVDFHQLGNIKTVEKGEKLATLTPADRGQAGLSVRGTPLQPVKVKNYTLRHGRNIELSKNKCHLYAKVSGHVSLVDNMVMLSDVYQVPANVDPSTGDIQFNGTVVVTGNVNTGYRVEADGDIVVNGVVEGATLISGGNIVLKRGMQGMGQGELKAKGNITAKFLENCKVSCEGALKADVVLHSEIDAREEIEVLGKKGLINGGAVRTYANIHASTLGSTMGAFTRVEVISEKELSVRELELKEQISDIENGLKKIIQSAEDMKKQLAEGRPILQPQIDYLKKVSASKPVMERQLRDMRRERQELKERIEKNKNSCISVEREVYSGVKLLVKDAMRIINEPISRCRFVREGADVKMTGM